MCYILNNMGKTIFTIWLCVNLAFLPVANAVVRYSMACPLQTGVTGDMPGAEPCHHTQITGSGLAPVTEDKPACCDHENPVLDSGNDGCNCDGDLFMTTMTADMTIKSIVEYSEELSPALTLSFHSEISPPLFKPPRL